eukprot:COSAG02_NODE_12196_length_1582_cov_1.260283_2_plen_71_part_01
METSTTAPTSFPLIGGRLPRTARSAASISACSREFSQLIRTRGPRWAQPFLSRFSAVFTSRWSPSFEAASV